MRGSDLIKVKRDGGKFRQKEIEYFVNATVGGEFTEGQVCATLMAIYLRGMDLQETAWLTDSMLHSGEIVDLGSIERPKVDKHSTGGVGDKVSLVLAPMVAVCGVIVPMISGRGLGHTGGTLDKLESIPGFQVTMSTARFQQQLASIGVAMIGQSDTMVPADRIMYALRDVTATVESIPLICASILSKKLAEGIDALVLDIKCGKGAFMKTLEDARCLGRALVDTGRALGKPTEAVITAMDQPLGRAVGNAVEVREVIDCLKGGGPEDLMEVTYDLGQRMLLAGKVVQNLDEARVLCRKAIGSGAAFEKFCTMVEAQGGDLKCIENAELLPTGKIVQPVLWEGDSGYVNDVDALGIGRFVGVAGGGRSKQTDAVDHAVGVSALIQKGSWIKRGEPLAWVHVQSQSDFELARKTLTQSIQIDDNCPDARSLILETLE